MSCAVEGDAAGAGAVGAGDAIEQAGLAGAVRPDDRHQLARASTGKRHVVERDDAAESQRDVLDVQERRHPHHRRLRRYCFTSR